MAYTGVYSLSWGEYAGWCLQANELLKDCMLRRGRYVPASRGNEQWKVYLPRAAKRVNELFELWQIWAIIPEVAQDKVKISFYRQPRGPGYTAGVAAEVYIRSGDYVIH